MGGIIENVKAGINIQEWRQRVEGNYRGVMMLVMGSRILARV